MTTLGFDRYIEPLKTYLQKYRETCRPNERKNKKEEIAEEYNIEQSYDVYINIIELDESIITTTK